MHKINRLIADLLLISYLSSSALLWCLWSAAASYSSCAHPLSHLWRLRCRQAGAVGGSGCYVLQSEVYLHCPLPPNEIFVECKLSILNFKKCIVIIMLVLCQNCISFKRMINKIHRIFGDHPRVGDLCSPVHRTQDTLRCWNRPRVSYNIRTMHGL